MKFIRICEPQSYWWFEGKLPPFWFPPKPLAYCWQQSASIN